MGPHASSQSSPFVLNGVLSLANAGTWLQMLRSKLVAASPERRRSDFADVPDTRDGTASEGTCEQEEPEGFLYTEPIRRSQSDRLFDRNFSTSICRRGGEMTRPSRAGTQHVINTLTICGYATC